MQIGCLAVNATTANLVAIAKRWLTRPRHALQHTYYDEVAVEVKSVCGCVTWARWPSTLCAEVTQLLLWKPSSPLKPPPKDQISPVAVAKMLKYLEAATALTTSPSTPEVRLPQLCCMNGDLSPSQWRIQHRPTNKSSYKCCSVRDDGLKMMSMGTKRPGQMCIC